ncbi:hypothetical protein [Noviherbaspirillum pedocola]|uniref:Uncharacterized protein n=1 Tax=Noviherbaspirillum pedocola TaxID=2801341 RepID=A0A934SWA1_9BURK|nr:hypothetical protein [Noviherbaspirillum pedocola]MBK4737745.1 hypothetical protein [Noviherbaspirillum pedocola]
MRNKSKTLCLTARTVSALLLEGCGTSSSDASSASTNIKTVNGVVYAESECVAVPVTVIAVDGSMLSSTQTDGDGRNAVAVGKGYRPCRARSGRHTDVGHGPGQDRPGADGDEHRIPHRRGWQARAIRHGYRYRMFVAPHGERRSFLNQASSSYLS